jgi:queuosine precursor transporter
MPAFMSWVVVELPPAAGFANQVALESVFGGTPRIVLASLVAYFAGEFANSYVLAKMKVLQNGSHLWMRTIGSTIAGEFVDSVIFYPLAFWGVWEDSVVISVLFGNYVLKVLWETLATPITYRCVNFLKRAENEDYYDRTTDFSPFHI